MTEYKSVAEADADCALVIGTTAIHLRELKHLLRRLEQVARLICEELGSSRGALLFGSEKVMIIARRKRRTVRRPWCR